MENNIELFKAIISLRTQMDQNIDQLAINLDITRSEALVLLDSYLYPNTSLIDLCERTGLKKSAVSKMIQRLEDKNLLTKAVCPKSKREIELNVAQGFLNKDFCWEETMRTLFPNLKNMATTLKQIQSLQKVLSND